MLYLELLTEINAVKICKVLVIPHIFMLIYAVNYRKYLPKYMRLYFRLVGFAAFEQSFFLCQISHPVEPVYMKGLFMDQSLSKYIVKGEPK